MSKILSPFNNNFVKYLNRSIKNRYTYLSFGITGFIIFEKFKSPISENNLNKTTYIKHDYFNHLKIYDHIKGFLSGISDTKISYTEENKGDKTCCDPTQEKDLVLTDKAFEKIKYEIETYEVVLFMKGNARKPSCGFSRQALDILKALKINTIRTVNVLEDVELRNGLKVYSKYPNFPQLYVRGKFVGGLDTISKMFSDGSLEKLIRE